jgi:hypothetical protein
LIEVSSDVVFDETNGSPREQVNLDYVDEDEVPTSTMRTMAIGDVRLQEQQDQDQPLLVTCSQMLWIKNKATQLLKIKGLRLSKQYFHMDIMLI